MTLSKKEAKFLLALGREAIEFYLDTKRYISLSQVKKAKTFQSLLEEKKPLFVVIRSKQNGRSYVRGEAGAFDPDISLGELVVQVSAHAAFFDPKTPRLKPFELNEIYISYLFPENEEMLHSLSFENSGEKGIKAMFRGRSLFVLPYQWQEFESPEQMRKYIELSLGAKGNMSNEVEYSVFDCPEISEEH